MNIIVKNYWSYIMFEKSKSSSNLQQAFSANLKWHHRRIISMIRHFQSRLSGHSDIFTGIVRKCLSINFSKKIKTRPVIHFCFLYVFTNQYFLCMCSYFLYLGELIICLRFLGTFEIDETFYAILWNHFYSKSEGTT